MNFQLADLNAANNGVQMKGSTLVTESENTALTILWSYKLRGQLRNDGNQPLAMLPDYKLHVSFVLMNVG